MNDSATASTWTPPVRDPAFARWLQDTLESNYGAPVEPYEIIDQLSGQTGFSEAELCELFGYPADFYANPEGDDGEGDDD